MTATAEIPASRLFWQGMRSGIPVVFGYIPVGIAYGVSALQAGFSPFETVLMSMMVYSGSGQVLGVSMTAQHAGLTAIFIATFLINFRYFIMSACIFSRLPQLRTFGRVLASWFVVDETFAIFTTAPNKQAKLACLAGIITLTYSAWVLGAVIGVLAHSVLPEWISAGLGIALYALFIAIVVPGCRRSGRILVMVLCTAFICCALSMVIDGSWAVVISTLVCAAAGAFFIKDAGSSSQTTPADNRDEAQSAAGAAAVKEEP